MLKNHNAWVLALLVTLRDTVGAMNALITATLVHLLILALIARHSTD
jgi:hypothetical protein